MDRIPADANSTPVDRNELDLYLDNGKTPTSSAPWRQAGSFGIGGCKRIVVADKCPKS
jgi:hypothetical protein